MRPAPAARFTLAVQRAPRRVASGLAGLALGSMAYALLRQFDATDQQALALSGGAGIAALLALAWRGASEARSLRWDGVLWHLNPTARPGGEEPGQLSVMVDIGPWMLLRFRPEGPGRRVWLCVHERGALPSWHALRCAVYSPRPVAPHHASADEAASKRLE